MPKKIPKQEVQDRALNKVKDTFTDFSTLLNSYRSKWLELFLSTYVFEVQDRVGQGQSKIFFPKCYEQVEKVAPRIYGNQPKFVVGLNVPINNKFPEADMVANSQAVQLALNYYWKLGQCQKKGRTFVKNGLVYGTSWACVDFDNLVAEDVNTEIVEENGERIERKTKKEMLLNEFPTFEVPDLLDLYFDPRVESEEDMTAIVRNYDNVRYADLLKNKEKYFNLDKVKELSGNPISAGGGNQKMTKFSVEGVPQQQKTDGLLNIKKYYGYFQEEPDDEECFYKITIVNDSVVIEYEELGFNPWVKFNPVEIPNQGVGLGVVEPILKLQKAYNLTRNQRAENVSLVLNRMWVMKTGAGIDPRKLVSRAGNVIPVKDLDSIAPLPTPDVTASSFEEANAINTEIQQVLGTIDTTQSSTENGFTNLATGQKIRWNEYNVRFKAIKQNFEEALSRLGEKMLLMVGVASKQNPLVRNEYTNEFFEIAKTAFDQVSDFYSISVLADSTANDSIENKREETLAFGQLCLAYAAQGVPIDMQKVWADIVESFPGKNPVNYMAQPQIQGQGVAMQGGAGQGAKPMSQTVMDQLKPGLSNEEQLNQSLQNVY